MGTLLVERTEFKEILYAKRDWVARITINRPQAYNAYSTDTLAELASAFRQAAFDDEVAVIVYTGVGDRAFCTGGDVKEYERVYTRSPHDYWKYMSVQRLHREYSQHGQAGDRAVERHGRRRRQ